MAGKSKSKTKGGPRLSIIPARAVTDPEICAQALRVLALLGRHTDDQGWCRRSQVTMAEELCCDRRTIQRGLAQLEANGYVERRPEGRGNIEPERSHFPFASYSYRVILDPVEGSVDEEGGCAPVRRGGAHPEAQGVRSQARRGCADTRAPLTERPLVNDPLLTKSADAPRALERRGDPALWELAAKVLDPGWLEKLQTFGANFAMDASHPPRVVVDFPRAFAEQYVRGARKKLETALGGDVLFRYAGREGQP